MEKTVEKETKVFQESKGNEGLLVNLVVLAYQGKMEYQDEWVNEVSLEIQDQLGYKDQKGCKGPLELAVNVEPMVQKDKM